MKNIVKLFGIIALVAVIGFGFVSCGGDDNPGTGPGTDPGTDPGTNPGGTTITYTAVANNATSTTAITLTFSAAVSGLADGDITITNGTGSATKGSLTGSGTSWSLGITVNTAGNVTVSINKSGIENGNKTVAVAKPAPKNATVSITDIYLIYTSIQHGVSISLSLLNGAEWTLADGDITDNALLTKIKSWVTIGGTTTPAINSWNYFSAYSETTEGTIILTYQSSNNQSINRGTVTATINQSKVSELQSYTDVTGTLTPSTETVSASEWTYY